MTKQPPVRNRRNIGQVVLPIEKLIAARELSSCCVGVEAALEGTFFQLGLGGLLFAGPFIVTMNEPWKTMPSVT
jgi:hypothetical protein